MTPLARALAEEIRLSGPIDVARFMARALNDPEHGYYPTRDPLGAAGDFTTAPEISQMFGEMVGLWLATVWEGAGRPSPFALVELGPGRGTLMADILRATARVPGFHHGAGLHLVETSPTLRRAQAARLGPTPTWHETIETLPSDRPLFVVANEFFDALPIRQFVRDGQHWRERRLGLSDGALSWGLGPAEPNPELDRRGAPDGALVEIGRAAQLIAAGLATTVAGTGGAILILDYGAWDGTGDTLQAVRAHAPEPVLAHPGDADLTAHVGFRWLAEAAEPLAAQFAPQGAFLTALGIGERAAALARHTPSEATALAHALERLTAPAEMGTLFKVLALLPKGTPPAAGFA
ncbi:MAG: SAM-dependent methyltransferase [Pseudomonadota bacterium]